MAGKKQVGVVTSPRSRPISAVAWGIGMVRMTHWDDGTEAARGDPGRRIARDGA
jgi:hypothetical protein